MREKARLSYGKLALYCIAFYAVWTVREFTFKPLIEGAMGDWGAALVSAATKLLIWTAPAWLLVRRYPEDMEVPRLFAERIHWGRVLLWLAGVLAYNVVIALVTYGRLGLHAGFAPSELIGTVLIVGITEEMVFRGLLLNTLGKRMKPVAALAVTSVLFVLIHFPIWISKGMFADVVLVLRSSVSIFVLGCVFGAAFQQEKNLLPPILLHMVWNLAVLVFFGG